MADNQLPVQIVILPPDPSQVSRTMASIQQQVEAQGRKVGQSMSNAITTGMGGARTDRWIKENLIDPYKKATPAARKALQQHYDQVFKVDSIMSSTGTRSAIERLLIDPYKKATPAARKALQQHYDQVFSAIPSAQIKANAKQVAAQMVAAQKEAYARSSTGVYEAAGIKGPSKRTAEAAAVRNAQKLLNEELRNGSVTLGQYNVLMGESEKRLNLIESGNVRARGALHKLTAQLASLTFEITGAVYGLGIMAATLASPMLFGISFLRKLEDSKLGMASILLSMGQINGKTLTFEQAMSASSQQMDIMAKESVNLTGKLEEFATTYRSILAPGLAAGMNLDEIRKIAIAGTVAVKTIGLDSRQIVQEIRDLVAGGIQAASSTLATSLGLTDSDIKRARLSSEGLFSFLEKRLSGFVEGARHRTETLSGKMEQFVELITQGLGEASKGAFESVNNIFGEMIDALATFDKEGKFEAFRPEFLETAKVYVSVIQQLLESFAKLIKLAFEFKEIIFAYVGFKAAIGALNLLRTSLTLLTSTFMASKIAATAYFGRETFVGPLMEGTKAIGTFGEAFKSLTGLVTIGLRSFGLIGLFLWGAYKAADYFGFFDTLGDKINKMKENISSVSTLDIAKQLAAAAIEKQNNPYYTQAYEEAARKYTLLSEELIKRSTEASIKITSENIQRMDGALTRAKNAMEGLSNEFLKGYTEGEKFSSVYRTYVDLEKELAQLRTIVPVGNAKDIKNQQDKIANYEQLAKQMKLAWDMENKLNNLQSRINSSTSKEQKAILEHEYENLKKLIPLYGKQLALKDEISAATDDVNKAHKEGLQSRLAIVNAEITSIRNSEMIVTSYKDQAKYLRELTALQNDAAKQERVNADAIRKARGDVQYTPSSINRTGTESGDIPSAIYGVKLPSVTGLNTASSDLAREDLKQSAIDYEEQRIALAQKYEELGRKIWDSVRAGNKSQAEAIALSNELTLDYQKRLEISMAQEEEMKNIISNQYEWSTGAADAFKEYNDAALNSAQHARDVWGSAFKGMEDGLVNFIKTGKFSFREFASVIIDELIRIQAQRMTMDIFGAMFSFGGTGYTAASGGHGGIPMTGVDYAKGAAFGSSGIQNFANGSAFTNGIVSTPTLFNFAKGTGRMGEAGPEAIMPLTRTTSGDLGVQVTGGAGNSTVNQITVNVSVSSDGQSNVAASGSGDNQMLGKLIGQAVQAEVIKMQRPGGILNR